VSKGQRLQRPEIPVHPQHARSNRVVGIPIERQRVKPHVREIDPTEVA
jgi:hypothetical protein